MNFWKKIINSFYFIIIVGVIFGVIGVILPTLPTLISEYFFIVKYWILEEIWIIELGLIISILFFFKPWNFKRFTPMDNLVKILTLSGVILFIHALFGESSLLTQLINYILKALDFQDSAQNSDEKMGYIIGSILGFTALLWGVSLRNKQLEVFSNRNKALDEHNLEDRFIRSVDLIGKKEQASRLGGLVGLSTLMYENVDLYERVLNYLGKFLRSPPDLEGWEWQLPINLNNTLRCRQISDKQDDEGVLIGKRPDINYIVQILREKPEWMKKEDSRIPFEEVHLEGTKLSGVNLKNANLTGAHLEETDLSEVNLENAILKDADLSKANLEGTNITGTDLRETKNLTKEQLKKCYYYVEAPPLLPAGWDPKEIGIQEKQHEEE